MRTSSQWKNYRLLDASQGEKLECWGDVVLVRPDPQVIWKSARENPLWNDFHGRYHRSAKGGGNWEFLKPVPQRWKISYGAFTFHITPTNFKHTGLFPEQAVNWDLFSQLVKRRKEALPQQEVKVLNLFAYTGGATLACAAAGAQVTHVDAAKGMVAWAAENAASSGLGQASIRWIVDDCKKFVMREIRRGNRYDAIIMDPPSYGRGPGGEIWKLEDSIFDLVSLCAGVLSRQPLFFAINSYTTGLNPSAMEYMLGLTVAKQYPGLGATSADEIGIMTEDTGYVLPCGSTALWLAAE